MATKHQLQRKEQAEAILREAESGPEHIDKIVRALALIALELNELNRDGIEVLQS